MNVKKGDNVIVITGKDKGKTGKVIKALPKMDKVIVEDVNLLTKRIRSKKQGEEGQSVKIASPIHISNVKLASKTKKTTTTKK